MPIFSLRGSAGSRIAGLAPRDLQYHDAHSEVSDLDDGSSLPPSPSESVVTEPRSTGMNSVDDMYDIDIGRTDIEERVARLEQYTDYLRHDLVEHVRGGGSSDPGSAGSRSPPATPLHLVSRLRDLGFPDSELSDQPDLLGDETESDGEPPSHMNSVDDDDDDDDDEEIEASYDEVPKPPQLPAVAEERLQEVWPLGDASFNIFLCPITHDVMTDPVVSADGYTYERAAIARWFETSRKSPVTGQTLPHADLVPNHSVRTLLKTLIDMTENSRRDGEADVPTMQPKSPSASEPPSSMPVEQATSQAGSQHLQVLPDATLDSDHVGDGTDRPPRSREAMLAFLDDLRRGHAVLSAPDESRHVPDSLTTSLLFEGRDLPPRPAMPCPSGQQAAASARDTPNYALTGWRPLAARPASQPQPRSQSSTTSPPRPQSSTGCPQRVQHPSTALPPLRAGRTPPMPEPAVPRGLSPPVVVPPLLYRSGALPPRPSQPPPFPPPSVPLDSLDPEAAASAVGSVRSPDRLSSTQSPGGPMAIRCLHKRSPPMSPAETT